MKDQVFFQVLERDLEKEIEQLYDPQKITSGRPNIYVYMLDTQGNYYFAVHTYSDYPFGAKLANEYTKVEVSNLYEDFLSSQAFIRALQK